MLTPSQLTHFNVFGFVPLRGLISQDEINTFNEEIQLKLESTLRYTGPREEVKYCSWSSLGAQTPLLASLIEDERFLSIAEQILGENCIGRSCNSGSYINNTNWHPDCRDFNVRMIKFPIYLQSLNGETGALRFIAGSHRPPLHHDVEYIDRSDIMGPPTYICETEPGDAFLFDTHMWHASWGGSLDRRMVSLIYIDDARSPEEEAALRNEADITNRTRVGMGKNTFENPTSEYPPEWLANPDDNPVRQRWIDWLHKYNYINIFHDASAS